MASLHSNDTVEAHAVPQPATAQQILTDVVTQNVAYNPVSADMLTGQLHSPHPAQINDLQTLEADMLSLTNARVLSPGPWCSLAPLFGNHFLPCTSIPGIVPGGLQSVPIPHPSNQFRCHHDGGYNHHIIIYSHTSGLWRNCCEYIMSSIRL